MVYKMCRPGTALVDQPGQLDSVIVHTNAFGQAYLQIEELLAVDVFRDAEARRGRSRAPLYGVLLEGHCREISFPPETGRVGLPVAFLPESEP